MTTRSNTLRISFGPRSAPGSRLIQGPARWPSGRACDECARRVAVEAVDLVGENHRTLRLGHCRGLLHEADEAPARAVLDSAHANSVTTFAPSSST